MSQVSEVIEAPNRTTPKTPDQVGCAFCVDYLLRSLDLKSGGVYVQGKITRFKRSQLQADKILDHLYDDCQYYFKRKYDNYQRWLDHRVSENKTCTRANTTKEVF